MADLEEDSLGAEDTKPLFEEDFEEIIFPTKDLEDNDSVEGSYEETALSDDKALVNDPNMAVFKQSETTIMWRIEGLYKDNGELQKKSFLRKNPPMFIIEDANGTTAEFFITQQLSYSLREGFDKIYRAYYGVEKKQKRVDPETGEVVKTSASDYVKENPLKIGLAALILVLAITFLIVF